MKKMKEMENLMEEKHHIESVEVNEKSKFKFRIILLVLILIIVSVSIGVIIYEINMRKELEIKLNNTEIIVFDKTHTIETFKELFINYSQNHFIHLDRFEDVFNLDLTKIISVTYNIRKASPFYHIKGVVFTGNINSIEMVNQLFHKNHCVFHGNYYLTKIPALTVIGDQVYECTCDPDYHDDKNLVFSDDKTKKLKCEEKILTFESLIINVGVTESKEMELTGTNQCRTRYNTYKHGSKNLGNMQDHYCYNGRIGIMEHIELTFNNYGCFKYISLNSTLETYCSDQIIDQRCAFNNKAIPFRSFEIILKKPLIKCYCTETNSYFCFESHLNFNDTDDFIRILTFFKHSPITHH